MRTVHMMTVLSRRKVKEAKNKTKNKTKRRGIIVIQRAPRASALVESSAGKKEPSHHRKLTLKS
jgi:hypothetical protein